MHMDKQITQSILVMLCSMRGTKIAKVEGLWLVNRPKYSVSEDPHDSSEVWLCSPFIVPSLNAQEIFVMSFHDITIICFDLSMGKTTAHVASETLPIIFTSTGIHARTPNTINASASLHLFLNPISLPVTLSPRYFGVPSYWSLNLFTHS